MDVLVEARREYLENMYEYMVPEMITSFYSLYLESEKMSKSANNRLIQYQKFLKEIKNWNNSIVKEHTDAIRRECPWFDDLIVAVIVSSVKIMSSVRLNPTSNKLSISTPTPQDFVHECYKTAAEELYKNPYVMTELMTDDEREEALWNRVADSIQTVVKRYVPIQQILSMNISSPNSTNIILDDMPPQDTEDPDVSDMMPEPDMESAAEEEPTSEPMGEPTSEPQSDVKSIPVDSDVLFPDASEKKLGTE
jgi:hypothetical protein